MEMSGWYPRVGSSGSRAGPGGAAGSPGGVSLSRVPRRESLRR